MLPPKPEKSADLAPYYLGVVKFRVKKSNFELERVNVRPELAFYWGDSPVNLKVQNPDGKVSPLSPVVDTPMDEFCVSLSPQDARLNNKSVNN